YRPTTLAPDFSTAPASRSWACDDAATSSGEPGLGSRLRTSARRARFWSSREAMVEKTRAGGEAGSLEKPPPRPCEQHRWCPALWQVGSLLSASGFPGGRAERGGGLHTTEMSGPLDTAIGHEVSHPSRKSRQGKRRGPAQFPPLTRSLRR